MNYYPHHIGDYARDTGHLSIAEHGAYRQLLDTYYVTERPLPESPEALCRICRAVTKHERDAVASVAGQFFEARDGKLHHKRADTEIAAYKARSELASASGKASAEARRTKRQQTGNDRSTTVQRPFNDRSTTVEVPFNGSATDRQLTKNQEPKVLLEKEPKGPTASPSSVPKRKTAVEIEADKADAIPLPLSLRTPDFEKAWRMFCQHRREMAHRDRRKPWTDTSARATLQRCAEAGPVKAAEAITQAVSSQWQGLHFDSGGPPAAINGSQKPQPTKLAWES